MHGGLKDEDRIFTNLYCQGDPFIKVLAAAAPPPDPTFGVTFGSSALCFFQRHFAFSIFRQEHRGVRCTVHANAGDYAIMRHQGLVDRALNSLGEPGGGD